MQPPSREGACASTDIAGPEAAGPSAADTRCQGWKDSSRSLTPTTLQVLKSVPAEGA